MQNSLGCTQPQRKLAFVNATSCKVWGAWFSQDPCLPESDCYFCDLNNTHVLIHIMSSKIICIAIHFLFILGSMRTNKNVMPCQCINICSTEKSEIKWSQLLRTLRINNFGQKWPTLKKYRKRFLIKSASCPYKNFQQSAREIIR